jgi:hypothetical protein
MCTVVISTVYNCSHVHALESESLLYVSTAGDDDMAKNAGLVVRLKQRVRWCERGLNHQWLADPPLH